MSLSTAEYLTCNKELINTDNDIYITCFCTTFALIHVHIVNVLCTVVIINYSCVK